MVTIVKTDSAFTTESLSLRASDPSRFPAVRTPMSEVYQIDSVVDRDVHFDYERASLPALSTGTWGTVIPQTALTRDRASFSVRAPKVGKTFEVNVGEIQSVRQTGQITVESLQSVQDRKAGRVFLSMEDYHERARIAAHGGDVIRADGSVIVNLRAAGYYNVPANPVIGLQLDAVSPAPGALRTALTNAKRLFELSLQMGQDTATGFDVQSNSDLHDLFRTHPETMEAYARWQDLAQPTEGNEIPFRFAGINFYDYRRAGIDSGTGLVIPRGVDGMFLTTFTPGDYLGAVNQSGLPRYLSVKELDHDKGFQYEAATFALHVNTRPEATWVLSAGAGDVSGEDLAALVQTAQADASATS